MIAALRLYFARWQRWSPESANARIFSGLVTVGGFTALVKLAGAAKVVVVARQFGTADALDAYLIAFLIPTFIAEAVAASVSASLIPAFIDARERHGRESAERLFATTTFATLGLLLAAAALLAVSGSWLVPLLALGFSAQKLALTQELLLVLLPVLVFGGLSAVWRSVLNAGERFALAAVLPVLTPAAIIASLLLAGEEGRTHALAWGTVGGSLLELLVAGTGLKVHGFSPFPRWHGIDPALRQVLRQYAPMIAATFLLGASAVVDQSMAAMLGPGSVSTFNYGMRLVTLAMALGPAVIGTVVLPHFSLMVTRGKWNDLRHTLHTYAGLVLLASLPLTLLLAYYSEPIVKIFFERGAFTGADTRMVAEVQRYTILQLPFIMLAALAVRLISSLKANSALMWGALLHLIVNGVLDYVLLRTMGVAGIGLSTAVASALYFGFLACILWNRLRFAHPAGSV